MLGIGHAISQKWVYDQHYGVPLAKRFHYNKPPTILDAPPTFKFAARRICPIRKRRSARAASASRRSAPAYGAVMNAIARRGRRRSVPSLAGDAGHDSDGARERWQARSTSR